VLTEYKDTGYEYKNMADNGCGLWQLQYVTICKARVNHGCDSYSLAVGPMNIRDLLCSGSAQLCMQEHLVVKVRFWAPVERSWRQTDADMRRVLLFVPRWLVPEARKFNVC